MHKQLPVHFPTAKCAHGLIRARSPLMGDGLMHIDTDPQVVGLAAYPTTFTYVSGNERGELANRELIPDLVILFKDRSTAFVQFVSFKEQHSRPLFQRKVEEVKWWPRFRPYRHAGRYHAWHSLLLQQRSDRPVGETRADSPGE